jgi:formate hydrogenlyase subunit 6/NADH:ubiquinone oxidoreductase subunit I
MRSIRRFYQVFFFALFLLLLYLTAQGKMNATPVTFFLDSSPLNGLGTLLAGGTIAHTMWIGFLILALSFLSGRFFCGWICPLGTLFHAVSYAAHPRSAKKKYTQNLYSYAHIIKFILLIALLTSATLGVVQTGLLDPISLLTRTAGTIGESSLRAAPALFMRHAPARGFPAGWLLLAFFSSLLLLNIYRPRFWCRYCCPLGALFGFAAKFSLGAVIRNENKCTQCGLCTQTCPAAASPQSSVKMPECFVCHNCITHCPENALAWKWLPHRKNYESKTNLSRRAFVSSVLGGITAATILRSGGSSEQRGYPKRIRPPGALPENQFLERCLKCGACMKICPTNVIQPAIAEAGAEGFLSPVMNMNTGYCELNCTLCGQVCPSGAIQRITIQEKLSSRNGSPVKIGTAYVDRTRCLPWSFGRNCLVCQEVCPVSPKAIYDIEEARVIEGKETVLRKPQVNPMACIGCGVCQHECPMSDKPAIRVTAIGESRGNNRTFLHSQI